MGQTVGRTTTQLLQLLVVITGAGIKAISQKKGKTKVEKRERREREMARAKTKREGCCKKRKRAMTDGQRGEEQKTAEKASTHTHIPSAPSQPQKEKEKSPSPTPPFVETLILLFTFLPNPLAPLLQPDHPQLTKHPRPGPPKPSCSLRIASIVVCLIVSF